MTAVDNTAVAEVTPSRGLEFRSHFCPPGSDPYERIGWRRTDVEIKDDLAGTVVFAQRGVEIPDGWSDRAARVVASKFFHGDIDRGDDPSKGGREHSVRQLVNRVAGAITGWGRADGYFATPDDAERFYKELSALCLGQYASFNSPVWFNVGLSYTYGIKGSAANWRWSYDSGEAEACDDAYRWPQCSACFIQSVDDDMADIMRLATSEAMLFKYGSGTGTDLSTLRSSREKLTGGGKPSGPVSFMRIYDSVASVIKSGGTVRRAAKMQTLKVSHPDILEFIEAKAKEDAKARALLASGAGKPGMTGDYDEAYSSVFFQNANLSVRVTDDFLGAVESDDPWTTTEVTTGHPSVTYPARLLMDKIAENTWKCGDPGMQYEDTIQRWHTCPNTAPINSSNPCCFVGETLVDTSEGRMTMAELESMARRGDDLPLAFAFDKDSGMPVLRPIGNAWISGRTNRLVEVTTERDLKFRCTPDHVWILRDGREVRAEDLKLGDRLRKIGRSQIAARGSRKYINHKVTAEHPNGCQYQARFMWEQANGPIPDGMEVHHKNEDCTDDRLSNLELKPKIEHRILHASGPANPRYMRDVTVHQLVEVWEAIEAMSDAEPHRRGREVTPGKWNAYIRTNGLVGKVPQAGSPTGGGRIRGMPWSEFKTFIDESRGAVNDRIVSVRPVFLNHAVPVYDLSVPGVKNFAIGSDRSPHSVVVHNSEYMSIDNSACNLASINLRKFVRSDGRFDEVGFRAAVRIMIVAQEILVDRASYPTKAIAENAHRFRQLGLGYANLGALLMGWGIPYDSDEGRALAGAITSIMNGAAYLTSAEVAGILGPFAGYEANAEPMLGVIDQHWDAARDLMRDAVGDEAKRLAPLGAHLHDRAHQKGDEHGYRNSQVTLLAPTGTIAFMMDCDTTGIEPGTALVTYKSLAGGGTIKIVNRTVGDALETLGHDSVARDKIINYMKDRGTVEGAPGLSPEHLPVFDCALPTGPGGRSIRPMGHVLMMAAVQPFLSGAISKTCNAPESITPEEIRDIYIVGWKLGLKALAVYRDNSKGVQPLTTKDPSRAVSGPPISPTASSLVAPARERLPDKRLGLIHHFEIEGHDGYVVVGRYPDGRPGEVFIVMSKEGSTIGGLMDAVGTAVSIGLQHGVPLETYVTKLAYSRFEPWGHTKTPDIPIARSIADYVFRWLGMEFIPGYKANHAPHREPASSAIDELAKMEARNGTVPARVAALAPAVGTAATGAVELHNPLCRYCNGQTERVGTCYTCTVCGEPTGCS